MPPSCRLRLTRRWTAIVRICEHSALEASIRWRTIFYSKHPEGSFLSDRMPTRLEAARPDGLRSARPCPVSERSRRIGNHFLERHFHRARRTAGFEAVEFAEASRGFGFAAVGSAPARKACFLRIRNREGNVSRRPFKFAIQSSHTHESISRHDRLDRKRRATHYMGCKRCCGRIFRLVLRLTWLHHH